MKIDVPTKEVRLLASDQSGNVFWLHLSNHKGRSLLDNDLWKQQNVIRNNYVPLWKSATSIVSIGDNPVTLRN